ncbi:hypothetical protein pb186bvf_008540 [Paramecium bursaria]
MIKRFLLFLVGALAFPYIEDNKFQRKLKCFLNELVPDPLPIFAVNGLYGVDPQFDKFSLLMRIDGFNETSKKKSMMVQLLQTHEQAFQTFFFIKFKVQFQHARYLQAEPEQISSTGMVYIKTTYTHFDPLRSFRVHLLQFHEEGEAYIETQQTFDLTTYKIIYRHQQQYIVKILFITPLYHKFKGNREQIDELKHQILTQNWIDCTYSQCSLNKLIVNSVKALKFQQIYPKYIKKGYLKLNDRLLPLELHNNILLGFIRQSSQLYLDINFYCQLEDRIKIDTSYLNYQGFQYYCTDYYVYKLILTNALNDQIIDDHFNLEQENNFLAFMAFQTNEKQQLEDLFKNISYQIISGQDKQLVYQCNQIVLLIHQQLIINIDYNQDLKQQISDLNVTNYQENNTILIQETFPVQYQEKQEININLTSSDNNSLLNQTNESPQLEQEQLNQTINKGFDTILLSLQQLINKKKHEGHKHTKVRHRKVIEPLIVDKIEVEFTVPVQMIEDQKLTISKIQVQMENEPSCEEEVKSEKEQKDNQENGGCEEVEEGKQTDGNKDKDDKEECEEEVKQEKEEENCEEDEEKQEQEEEDEQKQKEKDKKNQDDKKDKAKKDSKKKQKNKSQEESEDGQYLYDQNGNKIKNSQRVHKGRDPYYYQHKHHLRRRHYISKKPVFQTRYFKGDNDNKPSQYETYVGNNEQNPKFKVYYKIEDDPNVFSPFQENDDHLLQRYRHHHNDHDSSCYKFYDDCYYTGRMLEFCQNHPFMREKNIGFQIYSYYIPKGMWVRLYKQNEYDEITVQGTSQCLDDPLTLQRNFDI